MIPILTPHKFRQVDGFTVPVMPAIHLDPEYWPELLPELPVSPLRELAKTLNVPGRSKAGSLPLTAPVGGNCGNC